MKKVTLTRNQVKLDIDPITELPLNQPNKVDNRKNSINFNQIRKISKSSIEDFSQETYKKKIQEFLENIKSKQSSSVNQVASQGQRQQQSVKCEEDTQVNLDELQNLPGDLKQNIHQQINSQEIMQMSKSPHNSSQQLAEQFNDILPSQLNFIFKFSLKFKLESSKSIVFPQSPSLQNSVQENLQNHESEQQIQPMGLQHQRNPNPQNQQMQRTSKYQFLLNKIIQLEQNQQELKQNQQELNQNQKDFKQEILAEMEIMNAKMDLILEFIQSKFQIQ
ncbi:hypothetical protein OXYTRIMIC_294 [Oxytricha trifallax]|uniref:Uncharacterized protein n=1 Tax=Oxytricha trifallax TaxID=1172189 RepID=A0A073ICL5_9SPIT|nr:hypothetical protein OXYTRIMIC_294 [Oxytricha trifallax]